MVFRLVILKRVRQRAYTRVYPYCILFSTRLTLARESAYSSSENSIVASLPNLTTDTCVPASPMLSSSIRPSMKSTILSKRARLMLPELSITSAMSASIRQAGGRRSQNGTLAYYYVYDGILFRHAGGRRSQNGSFT